MAFVIGSFPKVITCVNKDGNEEKRDVDAEVDISDVLQAYMAPIRPFGCIYVFTGSSHKWVRGHYQLFEVDQSHISGVMKTLDSDNVGKTIFCMICGWMTPKQRDIVRRCSAVDTKLYMDVLSWFIQKS